MKPRQEPGDNEAADDSSDVHGDTGLRLRRRAFASRHRADNLNRCEQCEADEQHDGTYFTIRDKVGEGPQQQPEQHR